VDATYPRYAASNPLFYDRPNRLSATVEFQAKTTAEN